MLFTSRRLKVALTLASRGHLILLLVMAAFGSVASAQQIVPPHPTPTCPIGPAATYSVIPDTYPMISDQYAVQYKLNGQANWSDAKVYISKYVRPRRRRTALTPATRTLGRPICKRPRFSSSCFTTANAGFARALAGIRERTSE